MRTIIKTLFIKELAEKENFNNLSYFLSIVLNSKKEEIIDLLIEISLNESAKRTFVEISKNLIFELSKLENHSYDWNFNIFYENAIMTKKELKLDEHHSNLSKSIYNELFKSDYRSGEVDFNQIRVFYFMVFYFLKNYSNEKISISNETILSIFPHIPTREENEKTFKKLVCKV